MRRSAAQFIVADGEKIEFGEWVCIDRETGKLRKAAGQDRHAFPLPDDAWQEGDILHIPLNPSSPTDQHHPNTQRSGMPDQRAGG